jgi:hypothetical protein
MTVYHLDHWSGTDGVAMTTANTNADGQNGSGTLEFDVDIPPDAPAGSSMFADGQTAYRQLQYGFTSMPIVVVSGYLKQDANPGGTAYPIAARLTATGVACQFGFNTSGEIQLRDRQTTVVATTSGFPTNEWCRYTWVINSTLGVQAAYLMPESLGLHETDWRKGFVLSGDYTTGNMDQINIGSTAAVSGSGTHHHFYDVQVSDYEWIVPYSKRSFPPHSRRTNEFFTTAEESLFGFDRIKGLRGPDAIAAEKYLVSLFDNTPPAPPGIDPICYWGVLAG